jgi:hypothetical protein
MDFPDIFTWQIMKWVLIVLVAGFIGQFGKSFAQYVMKRVRRKKVDAPALLPSSQENQRPSEKMASLNSRINGSGLNKKETKALLKARKKEAKRWGI